MPVSDLLNKVDSKRICLILFVLAGMLGLHLFSPLPVEAASASTAPSVSYWPTGPIGGIPNIVGIVNQSDTTLSAGSLTIDNGATLSSCTVNPADYVCNVAGIQWNTTYTVTGWVTDSSGGTASVSWSFNASDAVKPGLEIKNTKAYWASYSDYLSGKLSVDSTLGNSGPDNAYNVTITGSSASSMVTLGTNMPLDLGEISTGGSAVATLHYNVPTGTSSFLQKITASAGDSLGNTYSYEPTQAPQAGKNIGISVGDNLADLSNQDLDSTMADIASLGVGWIRFDMAWDLLEPTPGSYNWARFDRIVAAANQHGLKSVPILVFTPAWARPAGCDSYQCGPAEPAQFAAYAAAAASHYAPMGVHTWEIWNEPNIDAFWLPSPDPAAYTQLLKAGYTAIKAADSQSMVISGGLSPAENTSGHIAPRDFLSAMYQNGAKNYMDAVGYHPYSFPALPVTTLSWSGWSQMSDLTPSIRSIMVANGDGNKQVWATEFGCPTNGPGWNGDELLQAAMVRDALQQASSDPWLGGLFLYTYKDLGTNTGTIENFFGLVRYDGSKKPAYYELRDDLLG
ncbi:MAG: beta-galactosidase [Actinobacteria bacterium]|nr:beta-galactosidase [Actinomycetota bacterium]